MVTRMVREAVTRLATTRSAIAPVHWILRIIYISLVLSYVIGSAGHCLSYFEQNYFLITVLIANIALLFLFPYACTFFLLMSN